MKHSKHTFTEQEVLTVLRNMGHDVECGACMSVAFSGVGLPSDVHTCRARRAEEARAIAPSSFVPSVGQWLWSTCGACYYGEIIAVGKDANGQPSIDIRVEDPNDLISCEAVEMFDPDEDWNNPLTTLELPTGVKPVLRHVLWRARGIYGDHETIVCNTPAEGCYRCIKFFWIHATKEKLG